MKQTNALFEPGLTRTNASLSVLRRRGFPFLCAWSILTLLLASCGGSMSEEQRKRVREDMEDHKLTQVSDAEIVSAAMDKGRQVFAALEKSGFDAASIQRIAVDNKVRLRYIKPGTGDALEVENQIIQAYIVGSGTGATQDNIQKLRLGTATSLQDYDSLLYSHAMVTPQSDGSINVDGVWNIYLSKRNVIRDLAK